MSVDLQALGARLQSTRQASDLTLHQLADRSGVSVSMLSAVERGEKAPTVVVLGRIADGLDTPVERLLGQDAPPRVVVRRAVEHERVRYAQGWSREILSPVIPGVNVE